MTPLLNTKHKYSMWDVYWHTKCMYSHIHLVCRSLQANNIIMLYSFIDDKYCRALDVHQGAMGCIFSSIHKLSMQVSTEGSKSVVEVCSWSPLVARKSWMFFFTLSYLTSLMGTRCSGHTFRLPVHASCNRNIHTINKSDLSCYSKLFKI